MVLLLQTCSSVDVSWAEQNVPAIVEAWYGGQAQGKAIADVLYGDYNPGGKLTSTWYASQADLPSDMMQYDIRKAQYTYMYHDKTPLYPFGFGLSYTTFAYDNLAVSDKHHKDPDWMHTWAQYVEIVKDYPEYLPNSYLQYYLYAEDMAAGMDPNHTRADSVINGREKEMFAEHEAYLADPANYKSPVQSFTVFGDFIVDAAASIAYNKAERYLVIVENNGAIPNLPDDAMVEVPAYVRSWGPEPVRRAPISTFYKGLIEEQLASEKLAVDAYFEHSYQKALEAIAINKTIPSTTVARKILDDLIAANGDFWPELH